jgi:antitoxin ParD1/3/4
MNISITADQEKFVESLVASGSFSDPSEVVNKALEMLKRRYEELRKEIQIGIDQLDRGEAVDGDAAFAYLTAQAKSFERPKQAESE